MQFIGPCIKLIILLLFSGCLVLLALDYLRFVLRRVDLRPLPRLVELIVQVGVVLLLVVVYVRLGGAVGINYRPGGSEATGYDVFFHINAFNLPLLVLCLFALVFSRLVAEKATGGELPHLLLVIGILGAGMAGDIFNIYLYYELFILTSLYASYRLGDKRVAGMARLQLVGTLLILFVFFLVFYYVGSFHLERLLKVASLPTAEQPLTAVLLLLSLALALKGGIIPFGVRRLPTRSGMVEGDLLRATVSLFLLHRLAFPFSRLGSRLGWVFIVWGVLAVVMAVFNTWREKDFYSRLFRATPSLFGFALISLGMGLEYSSLDCYTAAVKFMSLGFVVFCGLVLLRSCRGDRAGENMGWINGFVCFFLVCALIGLPPLESFWGKFSLVRGAYALPGGMAAFVFIVLTSLLLAVLLLPAAYRRLAHAGRGMSVPGEGGTLAVKIAQAGFLLLLAAVSMDAWWGFSFVRPAVEYIVDYLSY